MAKEEDKTEATGNERASLGPLNAAATLHVISQPSDVLPIREEHLLVFWWHSGKGRRLNCQHNHAVLMFQLC